MSVPNSPVVNAGLLYVNGLQLSAAGGDKLVSMAVGAARDSSDSNDIVLSAAVSINGANVGANGVDVAAVIANSMYAVYVIASSTSVFTSSVDLGAGILTPPGIMNPAAAPANPSPVAGMLSLAANSAPTLPYGYDMYRRVGWAATDSAANVAKFYQYDLNDQVRQYYWDVGVSVLAAGAPAAFASLALNSNVAPGAGIAGVAVPPKASQVLLDVSLAGAATVQFRPFGSSATAGQVRFASAGAAIDSLVVPVQLNAGVPTVQWTVSASTVSLLVTGFVDYL